jgi:hypothetical protein
MLTMNKMGWFALGTTFTLMHCGGKSETYLNAPDDDAAAANGGASIPTTAGSGGAATDECADSGTPEAGCGGEAGDPALNQYAPLRTACALNVNVNRRGNPVAICFNIK